MTKSLWVFGYGSLLWCPGFEFSAVEPGVVKGFSRRFYQGNITHRGKPGKPGRVATLIEDKNAEVWGMAYEVVSPDALPYLDQRECKLGGYITVFEKFYPSSGGEPFPVLVYTATKNSCHWLGNASDHEIANQIVGSSGPSGHNVEYLLRLAEFQRSHAPNFEDPHLFSLESLVRKKVEDDGLNLEELVGPPIPDPQPTIQITIVQPNIPSHSQFVDSLPDMKLRCLGI